MNEPHGDPPSQVEMYGATLILFTAFAWASGSAGGARSVSCAGHTNCSTLAKGVTSARANAWTRRRLCSARVWRHHGRTGKGTASRRGRELRAAPLGGRRAGPEDSGGPGVLSVIALNTAAL